MSPTDDSIAKAEKALASGEREVAASIFSNAADTLASKGLHNKAAKLYEQAALIYRDLYKAPECFGAVEKAILMLVRRGASPEAYSEIVRLSEIAASTALDATEYKQAADFYFRAAEFAASDKDKTEFSVKGADALEDLADLREEEQDFSETVSLLKKVSRLYYSSGDPELGERIKNRAERVALRWAKDAKDKGDLVSAGNALAEAAQIMQTRGEPTEEAPRLMMEAGELYEKAGLLEKAGNIYDAAQEAYGLQRLSGSRKQALTKSAEAYLKMEGKPEVVAPLLVKAGNMFTELGGVKAKWAFKRASDLFGELAAKANTETDREAEMSYLRHQAMCLKSWGSKKEAEAIYKQVMDFYLAQASSEEAKGNGEFEAVSLEELAEVLTETGAVDDAKKQLEKALCIYVELAEGKTSSGEMEEGSKYYSKAADCAGKMGDEEKHSSFHRMASERATDVAKLYEEMAVPELVTMWLRNAATEALSTNQADMIEKAIELLKQSAEGFRKINENNEAFEDLFKVFETVFMNHPDAQEQIAGILGEMDGIAKSTRNYAMTSLMAVLRAIERRSYIAALLTLQEKEDDLLSKRERLMKIVDKVKPGKRRS